MELFEKQNSTPVWVSFENHEGRKGQGGAENRGDKGCADSIEPGQTLTLCDIKGSGVIRRIWITIDERTPEMLRGIRLKMYWDDGGIPAVDVPLGAFFCMTGEKMYAFENELFSSPEGRSFCCFVPMPFGSRAKITAVNTTGKRVGCFFYDVDATLESISDNAMRFHARYAVSVPEHTGAQVELLARVNGAGRFLGMSVCVNADERYEGLWWGEGEVKIYLDGDTDYPSLCGTGSEDYIGTAWGQGCFVNRTQGCLERDAVNTVWYRFHTVDPIFFETDCRVCIQSMGGAYRRDVARLISSGVPLKPIVPPGETFAPDGNETDWVNFYRIDRYTCVAYYYLSENK